MMKHGGTIPAAFSAAALFFAPLASRSLAYRLPIGARVHAFSTGRHSAACPTMTASVDDRYLSEDNRRVEQMHARSSIRLHASKEIAALVLSALVLGGNGIPQHANAAAPVSAVQPADVLQQEQLIADFESRLRSLSEEPNKNIEDSTPPIENTMAPTVTSIASPATREDGVATQQERSQAPNEAQFVQRTAPSPVPVAGVKSQAMTAEAPSQPLVTFQERTFSIVLPEFNFPDVNFPTVAPIMIPDTDSVTLEMPKVDVIVDRTMSSSISQALDKVGQGMDLLRSLGRMSPKQSDYERSVAEFQGRVQLIMQKSGNPAFASGVPLAPEFNALFTNAKEAAYNTLIRPAIGPNADRDFALLVLATLPVITVALRSADANSRRPMSPPSTPREKKPRIVKFPNSPAKVDREAVEEARAMAAAAKEAAAKKAAIVLEPDDAMQVEVPAGVAKDAAPAVVADAGEGTAEAFIVVPQEAKNAITRDILSQVGLAGDVAAAVTANPEKLRTELNRLRKELRMATELEAKLEALEEANMRLSEKVEELLKRPTPEEALRIAEEQKARQLIEQERAVKLEAARERLSGLLSTPVSGDDEQGSEGRSTGAIPEPSMGVDLEVAAVAKAAGISVQEFEAKVAEAREVAIAAATKSMMARIGMVAAGANNVAPEMIKAAETTSPEVVAAKPAAVYDAQAEAEIAAIASEITAEKKRRSSAKSAAAAVPQPSGVPDIEEEADTLGAPLGMEARSPDEFDTLGDDLSKALRGVRGFDLDALDLEMDDLREEDIEELRQLEKEMGNIDMAALQADFNQEDEETITEALRMAAESAMAQTSGGTQDLVGGGASIRRRPTSPSKVRPPELTPERGVAAVGGRDGGLNGDTGGVEDWGKLTPAALKRKTVAELKGFLEERGIPAKGKPKKAELVEKVSELLQAA